MKRILAYAETRGEALRGVARETVTAARDLGDALDATVEVLLAGPPGTERHAQALAAVGADRILVAEHPDFSAYTPDALVRAVEGLVGNGGNGGPGGDGDRAVAAVLFPASARGKDLAPRVAARLGRPLVTEVVEIGVREGRIEVVRPRYAGKAMARVAFDVAPALVSLRPNVFLERERPGEGAVEQLALEPEPARQRFRPVESGGQGKLDVAEASTVVSGGRGMQGPENWGLLEELVEALGDGAALGASRAVVDAGWRPHEEQVGQTGKVVTPDLYFALGISGAIQHLAGMRTARVIVAVNKDPEAPIFEVADYGIVGDVFEVLPRLTEEIRALREGD